MDITNEIVGAIIVDAVLFFCAVRMLSPVLKKILIGLTAVLVAIIVGLCAFYGADMMKEKKDRENYTIYKGNIMNNLDYAGEMGDYYAIVTSGLNYSTYFVTDRDRIEVPEISRTYYPIKVYCELGENFGLESKENQIVIDGEYCYYTDKIVKITPDYWALMMIIGITVAGISIVEITLFAIIGFIQYRIRKNKIKAEMLNYRHHSH